MKLTELYLAELDREVERSRRALEQVPEGKHDWKPHDKSMIFGYLTDMVATIPMWITMMLKQDELDIAPKDGPKQERGKKNTSAEYIKALDEAAAGARAALKETNDEFLGTNWRLLAGGERRAAGAAPRDDSRHHQSLGPSSRSDDGLPQIDGRQGSRALRSLGGRQAILGVLAIYSVFRLQRCRVDGMRRAISTHMEASRDSSASISPRLSSHPCSENSVSVAAGSRAKRRRRSSSVNRRPINISTLRCDIRSPLLRISNRRRARDRSRRTPLAPPAAPRRGPAPR